MEKIWKNIDWTNQKEKKEFFDKYFNGTKREFVIEEINKVKKSFKERISHFVSTKIEERGKPNRDPTTQEIKDYINTL